MSQIYGITKLITLPSDVELSFWVANIANAELQNNRGMINFYGYKNKQSFEAGKPYQDNKHIEIKLSDIVQKVGDFDSEMGIYDAVWISIAQTLITLPSSIFFGGVLEEATIPGTEETSSSSSSSSN